MQHQFRTIGGAAKLLIVAALCMAANDTRSIELRPGQWVVDHVLSSPSSDRVHTEQSEFCLTQERATLTFDEIMAELNWAQCRSSNEVLTQSSGRADITCTYPEEGNVTLKGVMEATYSKESYRIDVRMLPPGDAVYVGVGRRVGDC